MSIQHHVIGRTILEISTDRLADVVTLEEELRREFQQQALPEIEKLFDQIVDSEEIVRLDRVVVDVGAISRPLRSDEFVRQLLNILHQTLSDRLAGYVSVHDENSEIEIINQQRSQSDGEVLLYFLEYGRLPWWVTENNWQTWLSRWEIAIQEENNWRSQIRKLLQSNSMAQLRLVEQFPEVWRHQLILLLQPTWTKWSTFLAQAKKIIQSLNLRQDVARKLELKAWLLILSEISFNESPIRSFPARRWTENWLHQLIKLGQIETSLRTREAFPPSANNISEQLTSSPTSDSPSSSSPYVLENNEMPKSDKRNPLNVRIALDRMVRERLLQAISSNSSVENSLWLAALDRILPLYVDETRLLSNSSNNQQQNPNSAENSGYSGADAIALEESKADSDRLARSQENTLDTDRNLSSIKVKSNNSPNSPTDSDVRTYSSEEPEADSDLSTPSQENTPATDRDLSFNEAISNNSPYFPVNADSEASAHSTEKPEINSDRSSQSTGNNTLDNKLPSKVNSQNSPHTSELSPMMEIPVHNTDTRKLSLAEEKAGLYISQAGLVLLHPFLRIYLDDVGLLLEESFRDELAQQTAIYLLHYLATGQTDAPEYELVLPKLLCNWPLNEPVSRGIDLPEAALMEAEHLLQTAIDYWQALKSTSPDGLREGFLQRDGKLTRSDNGNWKLLVERKAIDILLSRLPWGLSMVNLPWMEEIVMVEWT